MLNLTAFAAAVASILVVPGPSNTLLLTSGALVGVRRSLTLIACEVAGYAVSIGTLTTLGRALFALVPQAKWGLRAVLIAFILLTAARLWRSSTTIPALDRAVVRPATVFVTTVLNPKALIFAFIIFPPLADAHGALRYGGTFAAIALVIGLGWITFGAVAGQLLGQKRRLISRLSAVALVAFACVAATV